MKSSFGQSREVTCLVILKISLVEMLKKVVARDLLSFLCVFALLEFYGIKHW